MQVQPARQQADVGVIVSRFQTSYLTEGHVGLLDLVQSSHSTMIVILGVAPVPSFEDPLDFQSRAYMVTEKYPRAIVVPAPNHPHDAQWVNNLDALIGMLIGTKSALLYGGRDSFISTYKKFGGRRPTQECDGPAASATEVRRVVAREVRPTEDFRAGVIHAWANRYPENVCTVDIAVYKRAGNKVALLVGSKSLDGGWDRLPGGFVEMSDTTETGAARELLEETGLSDVQLNLVCTERVDDWRYPGTRAKVLTHLFVGEYTMGCAKAGDDLDSVYWLWLASGVDVRRYNIVPNHQKLIERAMRAIKHLHPEVEFDGSVPEESRC